jgi:membrane protein YqaA with SNARE-associated domain
MKSAVSFDPLKDAPISCFYSGVYGMKQVERRGFYGRLLNICKGRSAVSAFGFASFLESACLPLPIDLAMAPVCLAQRERIWMICLIGSACSVLGAIVAYMIGLLAMETIGQYLVSAYGWDAAYDALQDTIKTDGVMAVAAAGITPVPFIPVVMIAGFGRMDFLSFLAVVTAIRTLRFFMMGVVYRFFGASIEVGIERFGGWLTVLAVGSVGLSFFFIPLLIQ